ncbi:MAG: DUF1559 domain-containing protein [Planctomycetaceae bacterium]|nr:DUF1559 domain-containing protein [Planctomycetaceae bacterium]
MLFVFVLSISGCSKPEVKVLPGTDGGFNESKTESRAGAEAALPAPQKPPVALPTQEMLELVGANQNNFDTRWLLPDTYYVLTGQPKKFFETSIGKGSEEVLLNVLVPILKMQFAFDYSKVERFTLASSPRGVFTYDETLADGTKVPRQSLALRRVVVFNLSEPVASEMLKTVWNAESNKSLDSMKRRVGEFEYYDLAAELPTDQVKAGIFLPNDRTLVFFIVKSDDLGDIFGNTPQRSAAIDRLKRLDVDSNLFVVSASWEGVSTDISQINEIPLIGVILQNLGDDAGGQFILNFRSFNFAINPIAEVGKPIFAARYDAVDKEGAAKLYELFLGLHVTAQTNFASIPNDTATNLPLAKETMINVVKSINIEKSDENGFKFSINKFNGFDEVLRGGIDSMNKQIEQTKLMRVKFEQLQILANATREYERLNKKFPQSFCDNSGKPLLSWRVAILPLIGQQELYDQFNLKESWDSPTNLPLVEKIPQIFAQIKNKKTDQENPAANTNAKGKTQIQRFNSTGTPLSDRELTLSKMRQPESTVLLILTAPDLAVEWTKPDELSYEADKLETIAGNTFVGVTFAGAPINLPIIPQTNSNSQQQRAIFSALIKGEPIPMPQNTRNPANNNQPHDHDHEHDHDHHDHNHDHSHDHK